MSDSHALYPRASIPRSACHFLLLLGASVLFADLSGARAQDASPTTHNVVDELRKRVDALEKSPHGPALRDAGVLTSLRYNVDVSERIGREFTLQAQALRARITAWLTKAEQGVDPLRAAKGELLMRGYRSAVSTSLQGYAIYLPPNYNPERHYPLLMMLHGGSANGNLFLGVVLGNNMNWKEYHLHLWDEYTPRWKPDWIVVAPDGFGQVMWRFMGEQDVLDVLDDVQRHYTVDPDRVVLGGLSNGAVGAYNLGMRHASRFAAVMAIAGAPSWFQYAHAARSPLNQRLLAPLSGMELIENARNTQLHYYHGRTDGGPMKPAYVTALDARIEELALPAKGTWYEAGHDLLYLVHRHGRIYQQLDPLRREPQPSKVHLVTGDYRAARQHWLEATRIERYPQLATLTGDCDGQVIHVTAENIASFRIHVQGLPPTTDPLTIKVNAHDVYRGPRAALGDAFNLTRGEGGFAAGFPQDAPLQKRPRLSGPITDAYFDSVIHVFGTANGERRDALKKAAERGARGWPLWLWRVEQPVVADTDVTEEMMAEHHLVLYGSPGDNQLLDRLAARLPIRVDGDKVRVGSREFSGPGLGVKFIFPNPLSPTRYVLVQTGPTLAGVTGGHMLPDFLPDYVVYDQSTTRRRPRLLYGERGPQPLAQGFFDDRWQISPAPPTFDKTEPTIPPDAKHGSNVPTLSPSAAPEPARPRRAMARQPASSSPPLLKGSGSGIDDTQRDHRAAARPSQAALAATAIARRARRFPNSRARARHGRWISDTSAIWHIRDNDTCLNKLQKEKISVEIYDGKLPTPVPTPVELVGPVADIWFRSAHADRAVLMSCEMAARLPALVAVLKRHGVRGVDVMSSYRPKPLQSFHTLGLGLDLMRFWTADGSLTVLEDFERTPNHETCTAPAATTDKGQILRSIACELADSRVFSTVLTPNYNAGHWDHFHIDARPEDPRLFVR